MTKKAIELKNRYEKGYVTDTQLKQYLTLMVITKKEYEDILATKYGSNEN